MGRIKNSLRQVIGKTIQNVVICRNPGSEPNTQLFFVFKDGTSFEFWLEQNQLSMGSKVDDEDLDRVVHLAKQREGTKVHVVESPLVRIGKERIEREPEAAENNPLDGIAISEIDEEHALFLAIHRRDALFFRIARDIDDAEVLGWVNLFSAAFGSLLQQCSFEGQYQLYQNQTRWNSVVRPPSVLPAELAQFLGGLSVVNNAVYNLLQRRASVEAFIEHHGHRYFEVGEDRGREILHLLDSSCQ